MEIVSCFPTHENFTPEAYFRLFLVADKSTKIVALLEIFARLGLGGLYTYGISVSLVRSESKRVFHIWNVGTACVTGR